MQNNFYQCYAKRWFDLIFSLMALFVLAPLMLIVACAVKCYDQGPIFFRQTRIGHYGRPFSLIKFRSMKVGADKEGLLVTSQGDGRITPIGKILRRSKLDELPQLFNVIKGEMSLVGPRPEVTKYVKMFEHEYEFILKTKPGITDLAAIVFRNEELILTQYSSPEEGYVSAVLPQKIYLYQAYLSNICFSQDMKILLKTIWEIFKR